MRVVQLVGVLAHTRSVPSSVLSVGVNTKKFFGLVAQLVKSPAAKRTGVGSNPS